VTGMGVVTSLGHDPDTFYGNLFRDRVVSVKLRALIARTFQLE